MRNINHSSNKLVALTNDACKKRTNTIAKITSPKKRRISGSVMMMVTRGIKKGRTLKRVQTPRNLEQRRVLSLSIWTRTEL